MCSLEVPDVAETVAQNYSPEDVVVWLINAGDSFDTAWTFMDGAAVEATCLLDSSGNMQNSYMWPGESYSPYPRHVVIDRDGVIRYLAVQYDASALLAAIDAAL